MKKYFLTFCILALGLLTTLWVCAQSETTASENSKKTPGDQLLEFMMNPPEKYDIGGFYYFLIEEESDDGRYFRIKKDDNNIFNAESIQDKEIVYRTISSPLESYLTLFSQYENRIWSLIGNELTLCTNIDNKIGKDNPLYPLEEKIQNSMRNVISLFSISPQTQLTNQNGKLFFVNLNGIVTAECTPIFDNKTGNLISMLTMNKLDDLASVENQSEYMIGTVSYYDYETNMSEFPFPNKVDLYQIITNKTLGTCSTNGIIRYIFDHLNLEPNFTKESFEIIPTKSQKISWVSGTNVIYYDDEANAFKRILSPEEAKEAIDRNLKLQATIKQSKYRRIYVVLAIISLICFIMYFLKRDNKNIK